MSYELAEKNISLFAKFFNISLFKESWLLQENILTAEEIDSTKSVFSPQIIQVINNDFTLGIVPNQLQLSINENGNENSIRIISKIIQKLPHIPYSSINLTYTYLWHDSEDKIAGEYFINKNIPLYNEFASKDNKPRFGAYLSKDFLATRLKVDISPGLIGLKEEDMQQGMICNFDFEKTLDENKRCMEIEEVIGNWDNYKNYAIQLINKLQEPI